ncbi:MAG: DNA-directed RNA polymerase specialized sigma24 family protein [Candidatus Poriferisodalaceae bacterium]
MGSTDSRDRPEQLIRRTETQPRPQAPLFHTLLAKVAAVDRAVFVLREVFDVPYDQMAAIVDKTEAACRQVAHRARERVRAERPAGGSHAPEAIQALLDGCLAATITGDVDALVSLVS